MPRLWSRTLSLQTKVTSVILGVLIVVFALIPVSIHLFVKPLLLDEAKRIGVSTGSTLADEIVDQKMFAQVNAENLTENRLRELVYLQPNVREMEVYRFDPATNQNLLLASSVEDTEGTLVQSLPLLLQTQASLSVRPEDPSEEGWQVLVPILRTPNSKKPLGVVRLVVSVNFVSRTISLLTKVSAGAAVLGVLLLTTLLSLALRRTIENDRKLREAENQNLALSHQLQETEKSLMNLEKLAVMGQLTANFAHEIGTPLNAIGGHLSLLKDEIQADSNERIGIIEGQVTKIAEVVRGFLQNTSKPASQRQLVDPHRVMETTLQIVRPQTDLMRVQVDRDFNRDLGPIRMVPIELEQVLLNLVNNSLDSMREKSRRDQQYRPQLLVSTSIVDGDNLEISVKDNGTGIEEKDLQSIRKPFYTTKAPGEGTGLGLSICQDILKRYRGSLGFRSRVGEWTEVKVRIPFRNEVEVGST